MALTKLQKKLEGSLKYCYKWGWKASVCRVEISEKHYGDTKKHPDFGIDFLTKRYRKWQENISYTLESALSDLYTFKSARAGLPANTVFIKTGAESNLFVLDLDMKDGSLKPAFDFLKQIGYEPMTDEFTVKTQSGGLQVYMKGVPDLWDLLGTRSHIFGSGSPVDCRGPGGLVFGPNSEVICYKSDSDDVEIKKYSIADGVEINKPPVLRQVHPSLISFFKNAKSSYDMNGEANATLCTKSFDNMSVKQKDVIDGAIKKCTEAQQGFRSEECFSLLRLLIKFQLDVEAAYSLVKNVSKFSERDRKWFEEMWLKALPSVEFKPKFEKDSPSITGSAAISVLAKQQISADSFLNMNYDATPPIQLADPWLYNGGIIVICGSPGAGKTVTALDLCRAAITGGSCWCDTLMFQKSCRVLYFHGDLSASVFINNYLKRMGIPLDDDNFKPIILSEVLAMLNRPMLDGGDGHKFIDFNILDTSNRKLYIDIISAYRPDIVVLDSMSSFSYTDENDKSTMTQMLTGLKMVSEKYKHLVLALHHPRKENNDGKRAKVPLTMDDVRGSSAIAAHCDMVVGISKVFDDETGMQLRGYGKVHVLKEGARGLELQQFDPYQYRISNDADSNIIINYMDQEEDIGSGILDTQREDIDFLTECFEYSKTVYYPTLVEYIRKKKKVMLRMALKYLYRYVDNKVLVEHKEGRKKFYELVTQQSIFNTEEI